MWGWDGMSNQHTENHNDQFTFVGALSANHKNENIVSERNRMIDNTIIVPVPWKQYHRANIRHLARHSN
jgi:hypothetical protein